MIRAIHGEGVHGVEVDAETRCVHWNSELDIIAIKFTCCGRWYPCYECHMELAGHPAEVLPLSQFERPAVLCGACGHQLTAEEYLASESTCTVCSASFNPGCAKHYHLYFERVRD